MGKAKSKKIFVLSACVLLLLSVGLFFTYEKYRVKPLFHALPLSGDDITAVELKGSDGKWTELNARQTRDFCSVLDGCSLKFWSASGYGLTNVCGRAFLYTGSEYPEAEIMLSEDGYIGIGDFRSPWCTIYTLVDGGDALYQYLSE